MEREIDWTQEPFSEILEEFKASFGAELKRCSHPAHKSQGFVMTMHGTSFTSLSEEQENMFANVVNLYVPMEDMEG